MLAGDGGLFGPLGLTPLGPALPLFAFTSFRRRTSVELLILHLADSDRYKKTHTMTGSLVLAGDGGFEPPHTESESVVLPLDESPVADSVQAESLPASSSQT